MNPGEQERERERIRRNNQAGNEESLPGDEVNMDWVTKWKSTPGRNTESMERVRKEFSTFKQALMDIESEMGRAQTNQRLTATTDFKIVFAQLHRVSMTAVKMMASHVEEADQLLDYTLKVIGHASGNLRLFDQNTPPLFRRIGNYLRGRPANPWDISRHWPDGPITANGICSACNSDHNCRWLTDPALDPAVDVPELGRTPWCQPCYEARLLRRKKKG